MWIPLVPEIFDIKTYLGFTDYVGGRRSKRARNGRKEGSKTEGREGEADERERERERLDCVAARGAGAGAHYN